MPAKTSHTPGPWAVSSSVVVVAPNDPRDAPVICNTMDLGGPSGFRLSEAMANAHLIASAPDLLAALKAALTLLEYMATDRPSAKNHKTLVAARAAIRRAEGGTTA